MAPEILIPEEFAQKLRIGRTSLFEWKRKGILVQGEHYIRNEVYGNYLGGLEEDGERIFEYMGSACPVSQKQNPGSFSAAGV